MVKKVEYKALKEANKRANELAVSRMKSAEKKEKFQFLKEKVKKMGVTGERREILLDLLEIQQKYSSGDNLTKKEIQLILKLLEEEIYREYGFLSMINYEMFQRRHKQSRIDYNEYSNDYYYVYEKCDNKDCKCQEYKEKSDGTIEL